MENLALLPDSALTDRLYVLGEQERGVLVEFLHYLGEVGARHLYESMSYPSLFAFCTDHLGLTKASAFRRTTAARLLREFPVIADYLADGRTSGPEQSQVGLTINAPPPPPSPPPARVEPIAPELHVIRMTVSKAFVDDLKKLRSALSHKIPDGNLEAVLHDSMLRALAELNRRKVGTGTKRPLKTAPKGRTIPVDVERAVWQRDEHKCAFVGIGGRRCGSTHKLELHHIVPFGMGGASTLENLSVRCAMHNAHHAVEDYGVEHMARVIRHCP